MCNWGVCSREWSYYTGLVIKEKAAFPSNNQPRAAIFAQHYSVPGWKARKCSNATVLLPAQNTAMNRDHWNSWGLLCTENTEQCSTSSAQLCSQFLSLCFFQLCNASHRFWTQDISAPVATDLQGRENRLEASFHLLLCHLILHKGKSSLNYKILHISSTALHFGAAMRRVEDLSQ